MAIHRINISALKHFLRCETYGYYSDVLRRSRKQTFARALEIGTHYHIMAAKKLRGEDYSKVIPELYDTYLNSKAPPKIAFEMGRTIGELSNLKLGLDGWHVPSDWEILEVEQPHHFTFRGDWEYQLDFTPDALVRWNDQIWHVQHKTVASNRNLPVYWLQMQRDWHECIYQKALIANHFTPYGGTLLLTARKLSGAESTTHPERIITPQFITRKDHEVDKAYIDLIEICDRYHTKLMRLEQDSILPASILTQNRDHCTNQFGNGTCPYLEVCSLDDSIASDNFETKPERYI